MSKRSVIMSNCGVYLHKRCLMSKSSSNMSECEVDLSDDVSLCQKSSVIIYLSKRYFKLIMSNVLMTINKCVLIFFCFSSHVLMKTNKFGIILLQFN